MYPNTELTRLSAHKDAVRRRISGRREATAVALAGAVRPLEWVDRALAMWRKVSPVAKVVALPLALLLKKTLFRRAKILGTLVRWAPLALGIFRATKAVRR